MRPLATRRLVMRPLATRRLATRPLAMRQAADRDLNHAKYRFGRLATNSQMPQNLISLCGIFLFRAFSLGRMTFPVFHYPAVIAGRRQTAC